MRKTAFGALWLFVFVVPWELFITFPGFGTIGRLVGATAFGLGVLDVILRGRMRPPSAFHVLALLFLFWSGASAFWSIDAEVTQLRVETYAQLIVLAWLVWELAQTPERQRGLLQAYVLGAYVSIADTLLHYLGGTTVATGRYAAAGFNPNDLGFTLVLGLPMAWYLAVTHSRGLLMWVNRLYVPLGLAAVLLTASRGSVIPAAIATLIVPWMLPNTRLRTKVATGAVVIAASIFVLMFVPQSTWERLAATTTEIQSGDFSGRGAFWKAGLDVFRQHPILGVGAGTFAQAIEPAIGAARAPHQTFLAVLVGQGLIGLALFLGMFAAVLLPVRRMPEAERKFWIVVFATLAIGLQPRTWDYRKPLWFVLAVAVAHGAPTRIPPTATGARLRRAQRGAATPPDWHPGGRHWNAEVGMRNAE